MQFGIGTVKAQNRKAIPKRTGPLGEVYKYKGGAESIFPHLYRNSIKSLLSIKIKIKLKKKRRNNNCSNPTGGKRRE